MNGNRRSDRVRNVRYIKTKRSFDICYTIEEKHAQAWRKFQLHRGIKPIVNKYRDIKQ